MRFSSPYIERRTAKNTFYKPVNKLVGWQVIAQEVKHHY